MSLATKFPYYVQCWEGQEGFERRASYYSFEKADKDFVFQYFTPMRVSLPQKSSLLHHYVCLENTVHQQHNGLTWVPLPTAFSVLN